MSIQSALCHLVTDLEEADENLRYVLIGGLAVGAWGHPRATCRPEDLIVMKLAAGGPCDLYDAREVFRVNRSDLDPEYLHQRTRELKVAEELEELPGEAESS